MSAFGKYLFIGWCILCFSGLKAAACFSTGSGTWTNSATWSCGSVPTCGDSIVIQAGHTVSLTTVNLTACGTKVILVIKGTLQFTANGKLQLSCLGRIYVLTGGKIIAHSGASGNDNAMMTCGSTWWNAGAGTYEGPGCMPPGASNCSAILPVTLKTFEASACGSDICLMWTALVEPSGGHFELQRSSAGVDGFRTIYSTPASREKVGRQASYAYVDREPADADNYYRLMHVDSDGNTDYYPAIVVDFKRSASSLQLFPNPAEGVFAVKQDGLRLPVMVTICDLYGKTIAQFDVTQAGVNGEILVHAPASLAPGAYICLVSSGGSTARARLLLR